MKNRVSSHSHCRLETRANLIHMGSACMMTNLNGVLNISLGKKSHKPTFLAPRREKKYVVLLREIFDQFHFNLSCQSINNRKKEKCFFFAKYAVGGEITKKG